MACSGCSSERQHTSSSGPVYNLPAFFRLSSRLFPPNPPRHECNPLKQHSLNTTPSQISPAISSILARSRHCKSELSLGDVVSKSHNQTDSVQMNKFTLISDLLHGKKLPDRFHMLAHCVEDGLRRTTPTRPAIGSHHAPIPSMTRPLPSTFPPSSHMVDQEAAITAGCVSRSASTPEPIRSLLVCDKKALIITNTVSRQPGICLQISLKPPFLQHILPSLIQYWILCCLACKAPFVVASQNPPILADQTHYNYHSLHQFKPNNRLNPLWDRIRSRIIGAGAGLLVVVTILFFFATPPPPRAIPALSAPLVSSRWVHLMALRAGHHKDISPQSTRLTNAQSTSAGS